MRQRGVFMGIILAGMLVSAIAHAQQMTDPDQSAEYPASYFDRYRPVTALDMVRQVPGFVLDDGDGTRGFASSAGNLLINGTRPSAKQDLPSATLSRIPAGQVERIELLRGQAPGIDFQGQSVLINVWLRQDIPATVRWEAWGEQNSAAPFKTGGSISISDRLAGIDFNTGIDVERDTSGWEGTESRYDGAGNLLESGPTDRTEKGFRINGLSLNATTWLGRNFVHINSRLRANQTDYFQPNSSTATGINPRTREVIIRSTNENLEYELGGDVERALTQQLTGKLIILFSDDGSDVDSSQENLDSVLGRTLLREALTATDTRELITRLEFTWSGWQGHAIRFNAERAVNILERSLDQTDDRGLGPVVVDVPGADSRVREERWDALVQDTWTRGAWTVDGGLGFEASTLAQTGDAELERDFFFIKPYTVIAFAPVAGRQSRLRLAREVAQLDLDDFVSATVFEDDDLALGNPNLRPDTTWIAEFRQEQRLGRDTVFTATVFHHWINDVLDLLPLSETYEAPGNIGNGRRWGLQLEGTIPLTSLGLDNAKLDLRALWQDSTVVDPVTGLNRRLSGEGGGSGYRTLGTLNRNIGYHLRADYRQDFEASRIAWGWTVAERGSRPLYKVNELDVNSEGMAVNVFVETTRWFGIKMRLVLDNLLSFQRHRERTIYEGRRDLTPVETVIIRDRRHDISRIALYLNGSF